MNQSFPVYGIICFIASHIDSSGIIAHPVNSTDPRCACIEQSEIGGNIKSLIREISHRSVLKTKGDVGSVVFDGFLTKLLLL